MQISYLTLGLLTSREMHHKICDNNNKEEKGRGVRVGMKDKERNTENRSTVTPSLQH